MASASAWLPRMASVAQRSGRPDLALLIGQRIEPEQYGLIGAQMRHARSVGAAWRGLILNLHLNGRAVVPSLTFAGQEAEIGVTLAGEEIEGYEHILTVALAALPEAHGITVNTAHGDDASIARLRARLTPDVESMEGAAFMYACLVSGTPFVQVRAVSNMVERRNRAAWKLADAVRSLGDFSLAFLDSL